ncbi:MAG: nickel-dependent hydrogenase large subunit [Bacillota bacterium]
MSRTLRIERIDRTRGHGALTVDINSGRDIRVSLQNRQGVRGFANLLVGRHLEEVPSLVARVCGNCSYAHRLAAVVAIERGLGLRPSRQTRLLRELAYHGQLIASHSFHLYVLALPHYLGGDGFLSMAERFPEHGERGINLHRLGNQMEEGIAGRVPHPPNPVPGGFTRAPDPEELLKLRWSLQRYLRDAEKTLLTFSRLDYGPVPGVDAEFWAVRPKGRSYGYLGFDFSESSGQTIPFDQYEQIQKDGRQVQVGPLARLNLFSSRLTPRAKELFERADLKLPSANPFHNYLAESIELVFSMERSLWLIDTLLKRGIHSAKTPAVRPKARRALAAIEAPQGTLVHDYEFDEAGLVSKVRIIPPVVYNQPLVAAQVREAARVATAGSDEGLTSFLKQIIRAYDPCFYCGSV